MGKKHDRKKESVFTSLKEFSRAFCPDSYAENILERLVNTFCSGANLTKDECRLSKYKNNPKTGIIQIKKPPLFCDFLELIRKFYESEKYFIDPKHDEKHYFVVCSKENKEECFAVSIRKTWQNTYHNGYAVEITDSKTNSI